MKDKFTSTKELQRLFPKLKAKPAGAKTTSPIDRYYNCVAWALEDQKYWWEPFEGNFPLTHWPIARGGYSIAHYVEMFVSQGFEPCDGGEVEAGYAKIVLYTHGDVFSHVSRQTEDPQPGWASKCGQQSDIWHASPDLLEGAEYGNVWGYMRKPVAGAKEDVPAE